MLVFHLHISDFVSKLQNFGLCVTSKSITFKELVGSEFCFVANDLRHINKDISASMKLELFDSTFVEPNAKIIHTISIVHDTNLQFDISKYEYTIDEHENFVMENVKNVLAFSKNINDIILTDSTLRCLICSQLIFNNDHWCSFYGKCKVVVDGEERCIGVIVDYNIFNRNNETPQPLCEITIIKPTMVASALCGLLDFILKLFPEIEHHVCENGIANPVHVSRIPVSITSIQDMITHYVPIVSEITNLTQQNSVILETVLKNVGMSLMKKSSRIEKIMLPFRPIESIQQNDYHNVALSKFIKGLQMYYISPTFACACPLKGEIRDAIGLVEKLTFRREIQGIQKKNPIFRKNVILIINKILEKNIHENTLFCCKYVETCDFDSNTYKSLILLFETLDCFFLSIKKNFFREKLGIHSRKNPTGIEAIEANLRFVFFLYLKFYRHSGVDV